MPLYEYACRACGHRFELLQRMGAGSEAVECPSCGAEQAERRLSTFAAMAGGAGGASRGASLDGGCGRPQCGSGFT